MAFYIALSPLRWGNELMHMDINTFPYLVWKHPSHIRKFGLKFREIVTNWEHVPTPWLFYNTYIPLRSILLRIEFSRTILWVPIRITVSDIVIRIKESIPQVSRPEKRMWPLSLQWWERAGAIFWYRIRFRIIYSNLNRIRNI